MNKTKFYELTMLYLQKQNLSFKSQTNYLLY